MVDTDTNHINATMYEYDDKFELVVDLGINQIIDVVSREDILIIQTKSGRERIELPSEIINGELNYNNGIVTVTKEK